MNRFVVKRIIDEGEYKILHYFFNNKRKTRVLSKDHRRTMRNFEGGIRLKELPVRVSLVEPTSYDIAEAIKLYLNNKIINYNGDL